MVIAIGQQKQHGKDNGQWWHRNNIMVVATLNWRRQHDNDDTTNDGKTYGMSVGGILSNEEDQLEVWDIVVIVQQGFEETIQMWGDCRKNLQNVKK